jgi:hypothetical protein
MTTDNLYGDTSVIHRHRVTVFEKIREVIRKIKNNTEITGREEFHNLNS